MGRARHIRIDYCTRWGDRSWIVCLSLRLRKLWKRWRKRRRSRVGRGGWRNRGRKEGGVPGGTGDTQEVEVGEAAETGFVGASTGARAEV